MEGNQPNQTLNILQPVRTNGTNRCSQAASILLKHGSNHSRQAASVQLRNNQGNHWQSHADPIKTEMKGEPTQPSIKHSSARPNKRDKPLQPSCFFLTNKRDKPLQPRCFYQNRNTGQATAGKLLLSISIHLKHGTNHSRQAASVQLRNQPREPLAKPC